MTSKTTSKKESESCCDCTKKSSFVPCQSSPIYGMGVVGAAFYFLQNASTFSDYLLGIGRSLIWPGYLVYFALKSLHVLD